MIRSLPGSDSWQIQGLRLWGGKTSERKRAGIEIPARVRHRVERTDAGPLSRADERPDAAEAVRRPTAGEPVLVVRRQRPSRLDPGGRHPHVRRIGECIGG